MASHSPSVGAASAPTTAPAASGASANVASSRIDRLTIVQPDDWHVHLRDGATMRDVVQDTARQFRRAIIMPNLKPPVTTTAQAVADRSWTRCRPDPASTR